MKTNRLEAFSDGVIAIIITIALIIYKNHIKFKKKGDIKI